MEFEQLTVENVLSDIKSGIGIDAAKNHTGVCIWNGSSVELYGFEIKEYDKSDYFAEYRMRMSFKEQLKAIVAGKHFEICIIEDVYGGENFDTVRKLLALNTVIDELIFEGTCTVDNFYRHKEPTWVANLRWFYRQKGKPNVKYEVQEILGYLNFEYYLEHKNDPDTEEEAKKLGIQSKASIFFEDKCDATGLLLSVMAMRYNTEKKLKADVVKISDIKMLYVNDKFDTDNCRDKRIKNEVFLEVDLNFRNIEASVLNLVTLHPDDVMCAELPVNKLGTFGMKRKFEFFPDGEGYLYFYNKKANN